MGYVWLIFKCKKSVLAIHANPYPGKTYQFFALFLNPDEALAVSNDENKTKHYKQIPDVLGFTLLQQIFNKYYIPIHIIKSDNMISSGYVFTQQHLEEFILKVHIYNIYFESQLCSLGLVFLRNTMAQSEQIFGLVVKCYYSWE